MFQENELLRASLAGDRNAFEKIVGRYQSAICAITFSGTGRLDASEELAQETFASAWANLHQLRDLSGFRFWLYSIARNALRNYQRQKRPASTDVDLAEATTEDTQNPAEILMREEERILLEQAILRLPVKYREPLVLFCRQERSVREAAEVLGLSEATFRTRLHRARKLLKEQIADRLEQTLRQTGPRKGFTKAVMVAIGSVPVGWSATADAAVSGLSGHTGLSPGMATLSTGVGMKIAVAAALLAVGALVYTQWSKTAVPASRPNDASEIRVEPSAVPSQNLADTRPESGGENPPAQATDAIASRSESDRDRLPPSPETASSEEPAVPETTVTGTVLDRNTLTPITAARVGFTPAETVATDSDGRFRLSYQESREEAQICVMASGYASQQITMRMNSGNHQGVLLKMAPGVTLVGTVVDPNHDPIENASLYVFGSRFTYAQVRSDEEGRFRVDGLDPEDDSVYLVAEPTGHFSGSSVAVTLERLGEERVVEIVLVPRPPRPVLIGQVTDARSEPVAQATVGCIGKRIQTITDSQGRYRLEAPDEDSFVLYITDPKYPLSTELVTLSGEQTEIRLDVQLGHPRALSGRIVDDQGHPISGAEIGIESYRGQNVWGLTGLFRSDSQGNFTIPNAPLQDDYRLLVLGNGILRTTQTIEPGQDECLIVVSRSGRIYGQVIDADTGNAIACFQVGAQHVQGIPAPWGVDGLTFTSEKGNFDTGWLELVHGASLPVTVYADGYDPLTLEAVPVQVISESPDRTVFGLRRNARRSTVYVGRVVDGEGRPVPGAEVGFRPRYQTPSRKGFSKVLTDAWGTYVISSIDPDEQILYVQAEGFAPRYCRMSELLLETPSAFADVVLDPAPTVSGFIWDELGQIVAHATVTSFPVARSMEDAEFTTLLVALWPRTQTDEQGHYRLTGLPIGEVHINVQFPNQQRMAPTDVTLSPGDSAEVNFGNQGGFVVSGIVVEGADGMQDVDVQLGPLDPNAKSHFGRTDAAGRFKLIGVPPGQYVFAALRPREATNGQAQDPNDLTHVLYEVMEIQTDLDLTVDYQTRSIHKQSPFP